jgi:hypothetical protein
MPFYLVHCFAGVILLGICCNALSSLLFPHPAEGVPLTRSSSPGLPQVYLAAEPQPPLPIGGPFLQRGLPAGASPPQPNGGGTLPASHLAALPAGARLGGQHGGGEQVKS